MNSGIVTPTAWNTALWNLLKEIDFSAIPDRNDISSSYDPVTKVITTTMPAPPGYIVVVDQETVEQILVKAPTIGAIIRQTSG
jgi:hypothetical protein